MRPGPLPLAVCLVLIGASAALAAKAPPVFAPAPDREIHHVGVLPTTPVCQLGEINTGGISACQYIEPPDRYFVLLHATACGSCIPPDSLVLETAHVLLDFRVQCVLNVAVSIVGTSGSADCRTPDTTKILCPRRFVDIEPTGSGRFDLSMALASACKIDRDAFLSIEYLGLGPECTDLQIDIPCLVTSQQCPLCESYNDYAGNTHRDDLCQIGFTGRLSMYVDAQQCIVPTLPRTWGALKLRYR